MDEKKNRAFIFRHYAIFQCKELLLSTAVNSDVRFGLQFEEITATFCLPCLATTSNKRMAITTMIVIFTLSQYQRQISFILEATFENRC